MTLFLNNKCLICFNFLLKKESELIDSVRKSWIENMMGPAGLVNKTSSISTSTVDEVGLATLTYSFAGRFS